MLKLEMNATSEKGSERLSERGKGSVRKGSNSPHQ